ncbi:hypothetical protein MSAN_02415800 [Mycena sanguinolenta]|uniref:DUF6532 domain-containing protein n=1 Tax=Mycena sanguinolenta TaxID=230812 RepID=A0A8H7CFI4_9AGAR|nr:hypothetical protein MSAN_02415800 [Mycena sanguinolenta]
MAAPFDPSFAANQPQVLGRGHRPGAENEAMIAHRVQVQKNAEIAAKRLATRHKNKERRAAAAAAAAASSVPTDATPVPLVAPQVPQLTATGITEGHPATPVHPRPVLHTLPAQQIENRPASSPILGLSPHAGSLASTPLSTGLNSSPRTYHQLDNIASTPTQAGPPQRTMAPPQYPDLQPGGLLPAVTLPGITSRFASMTPQELDQLDGILQLMQQGSNTTIPPLDMSSLTNFATAVRTQTIPRAGMGNVELLPNPERTIPHPLQTDNVDDADLSSDRDDQDNRHRTAQSSLAVQMRDVPVHRKRPRRRQNAAMTAAEPTDSEDERPAQRRRSTTRSKKRYKRKQSSRSIKDISVDRQPIVKAAYSLIQEEVICASGFPVDSPSGKVGAPDDEFGNMVLDSWADSHDILDVSYVGKPVTPERNLIRSRVPAARLAFKRVAELLVPGHYGLVNFQTLPNLTPELKAKTIDENRTIIAKIEHSFYYKDPYNITLPDSMYRHAIIQAAFNLSCFGKNSNRRAHYFDGMDAVPVETVALIVTAIKCALDQWKTGEQGDVKFDNDTYRAYYRRVSEHLYGWVEYTATQSIDTAGILLKDMLRVARETSGLDKTQDKPEEDVFLGFSAGSYATNQPPSS